MRLTALSTAQSIWTCRLQAEISTPSARPQSLWKHLKQQQPDCEVCLELTQIYQERMYSEVLVLP